MPELPFPEPPSAYQPSRRPNPTNAPEPDPEAGAGAESGAEAGAEAGRARAAVSPPNVWLCADPPGPSAAAPVWARRVIAALTEPGERVIVRALSGYPALPADTAALLRAAGATARLPVALLPTPCLAARTRALLRTHPAAPAAADPAADSAAVTDHPAATGDGVPDTRPAAAGQSAATGESPATGHAAATGESAATEGFAATGHAGAAGEFAVTSSPGAAVTAAPVAAVVGVGRRRAATEHGPAAVVIVLAGPVAAHARLPRRTMPCARLLSAWARVLHPGGVIAVLSPPPLGRHRAPGGRWEGSPVPGLGEAGLSWTEHIVLIHAPTTPDGLDHPDLPRRPELPFAQVHTCLDLLEPDHTHPSNTYPSDTNPSGTNPSGTGATR